jgi:hypothetical protein
MGCLPSSLPIGNHVQSGEIFPLDIFVYQIAKEFVPET